MAIDIKVGNSCKVENEFCKECSSRFMEIRPEIKDAIITKHFIREVGSEVKASEIAESILSCSNVDVTELHKFEENINGIMLFRAKMQGNHTVYCFQNQRLIFLRFIKNFDEYRKFIDDRKMIKRMVREVEKT